MGRTALLVYRLLSHLAALKLSLPLEGGKLHQEVLADLLHLL